MKASEKALQIIRAYEGPDLRIMEVCGTHTHAIFEHGIRQILPESIRLISGPGCPVCVTETDYIDEAVWLALEKGCVITTFGDLVRVPGSSMSLAGARAQGADIRTVYTPLDAVEMAAKEPEKEFVFLSVGFETTVPISCLAVRNAARGGIGNFSILTANKTMDMAYRALKGSADAFLYPGHVSTFTGMSVYRTLAEEGISGAVCGFTPSEILAALAVIVVRLSEGKPFAENCYPRVVTEEGMPEARALVSGMMEACPARWRGIGEIEGSGLRLREVWAPYDARKRYDVPAMEGRPNPACRCGEILLGMIRPKECPLFGKLCTPEHPVGACMVSSEGTCSAYYKYDL